MYAVAVESRFQISCLKKEIINNVDKRSVILKQCLHVFLDNKINEIVK